jgi:hypothetical protein
MSYSYLSSVYPDFKVSKTYNNVYNSIAKSNNSTMYNLPVPIGAVEELDRLAQRLGAASSEQQPQVEQFQNEKKSEERLLPQERDNLRFRTKPLPIQSNIEQFEQADLPRSPPTTCDMYASHVVGCSKCKAVIMKQFNLENDRVHREQVLEVSSLLLLGAFILLLVDYFQARK